MLNRRVITSGILFLMVACHVFLRSQTETAYADDISSLLDQATATCSQAESTAGQSFGCTNFGSLYSSMSGTNQMSNQMQEFGSAVSTGMNLLGNLFGSGLQGLQQQMGQSVQQGPNQEIQNNMNQQVQQSLYEQKQRQLYNSYALGQTGISNLTGFIPKSTRTSNGPYQTTPYHSQRNPLYEDPGPPSYNNDNRNQRSDGQTRGSTAFFGLGGTPRTQLDSDPRVVDLRNPAVPAALDQAPFQGRGLVQKNPNSFDFDGTGKGDNRIFFKQRGGNVGAPYDVSSAQAQTLKSPSVGMGFMKQSSDYITKLLKGWSPSANNQVERGYFLPKEQKPMPLHTAIEENMRSEKVTGRVKCNFYAASIGKNMGVPYFMSYPDKVDQANRIYDFIQYAIGDPKTSGWKEITPEKAQELANEGKFVIAVAKSKVAKDSGHIAVVAPKTMSRDMATDTSQLPWVRDNNFPNSSVRANYAFTSLKNQGAEKADTGKPIWAVWEGQ